MEFHPYFYTAHSAANKQAFRLVTGGISASRIHRGINICTSKSVAATTSVCLYVIEVF